jgi:peptidoglycan/xylan/chitin deacetylase (PgdA/CDA1 family)
MKFPRYLIFVYLLLTVSCTLPSNQRIQQNLDEEPTRVSQADDGNSLPSITQAPSLTPSPSATLEPTLTVIPPTITPPPPQILAFKPSDLRIGVEPVAYIDDPCFYLENRWGEGKSEPGTIVVPIMFHSVVKPGREITDPANISMEYFEFFMERAKALGFSTITTDELIDFLGENRKIPERSMILILDDQRPGVTELFMPYLEENNWTLTLAWPTYDGTRSSVWEQMETLAESGRLDVQSHGHNHIYIQDHTPLEMIEEEVYAPIEVISTHFGTTPRALIWPGGNYTEAAIQTALNAGFKVGFTVYSRGPLMYNWIPLGEAEREMSDPLMVLPRAWSMGADLYLEKAMSIGEAARLEAEQQKASELQYLSTYCQTSDGE